MGRLPLPPAPGIPVRFGGSWSRSSDRTLLVAATFGDGAREEAGRG